MSVVDAPQPQSAREAFELGVALLDEDRREDAEEAFVAAMASDEPGVVAFAAINLASIFFADQRLREAEDAYQAALATGVPEVAPAAAYALGLVYAALGQEDDAERAFHAAVDSDDVEYSPLAAYDLAVTLIERGGRDEDAVALLLHAARSGHADYAPAAAFNLGTLLAGSPGHEPEAEAAYRAAIASGHPEIAPRSLVNLAGLLERLPTRVEDAEATLRAAMDTGHPDQAPMAAANLGNLLSSLPGRAADAEQAFREAATSDHPEHAARASYNLGVLLLGLPGRTADAEAAFRAAAESNDYDHAPRAAFNLGRLLLEDPARANEAEEAFAFAAASGHAEIAPAAQRMLQAARQLREAAPDDDLPLLVAEAPEGALTELPSLPVDNRVWQPIVSIDMDGRTLEEFVPSECTPTDAAELIAATSVRSPASVEVLSESIRDHLASAPIDGRFLWSVVGGDDDGMTYRWDLEDDVAHVETHGLVRVLRGATAVHAVHYERRDTQLTPADEARWVERLGGVRAVHRLPAAAAQMEPLPEAVQSFLALSQEQLDKQDTAAMLNACEQALAALTFSMPPELRGSVNFLHASLLALAGEDDAAIVSYRRAYRLLLPGSDTRARTLLGLARCFAHRGVEASADSDRAHAAAAARTAAAAFDPAIATSEWAEGVALLSWAERSTGTEVVQRDLDRLADVDLEAWANAAVALGDAYLALPDTAGDTFRRESARAAYNAILERLGAMDPSALGFDGGDDIGLIRFTMIATARLQQLEPLIGGTPPRSFRKQEEARFGAALYLRPFLSGTELRIGRPKPRRRLPQRAGAPDVALEDALYACLFPDFVVTAIGGAASSFGAGRFATVSADPEGWKDVFEVLHDSVRLIVLVPHTSPGVEWEIDELHRRGSLDRTLLVMPPPSSNYDVAALWSAAVQLCYSHGLRLPAYDPRGALLLLREDGGIRERWSFDLVWRNRLALRLHRVLPPAPAPADADA